MLSIFTFLFMFLSFTSSSYAYLDPGSGNMFIQAVATVVAGIAMITKVYWHKVKAFFFFINKKKLTPEDSNQTTPDNLNTKASTQTTQK